jgi:hypothetical protein
MAEKTRGIGNGLFGVILGAIETIFGSFIISFATYWSMMTASITSGSYYGASYLPGMYGVTGSMISFGGIYVLLHGIKRVVDQAFMAYLAGSKKQE